MTATPQAGRDDVKEKLSERLLSVRDKFGMSHEDAEILDAAAAALRAVEGVCVWTIDDIDESWDGSCGAKWQFTEGGPIENDMRHCPQCGKNIALVPLDAADGAEVVS